MFSAIVNTFFPESEHSKLDVIYAGARLVAFMNECC